MTVDQLRNFIDANNIPGDSILCIYDVDKKVRIPIVDAVDFISQKYPDQHYLVVSDEVIFEDEE